jgi:hypothetical protein
MPGLVSGKEGRVAFGATDTILFEFVDWSVEDSGDIVEGKMSENFGETLKLSGFHDVKITIKGFYNGDAGKDPFANQLLWSDVDYIDWMKLMITQSVPILFFHARRVICSDFEVSGTSEGAIEVSYTYYPEDCSAAGFAYPGDAPLAALMAAAEEAA